MHQCDIHPSIMLKPISLRSTLVGMCHSPLVNYFSSLLGHWSSLLGLWLRSDQPWKKCHACSRHVTSIFRHVYLVCAWNMHVSCMFHAQCTTCIWPLCMFLACHACYIHNMSETCIVYMHVSCMFLATCMLHWQHVRNVHTCGIHACFA